MKKTIKIVALILAIAIMAISFVGCSNTVTETGLQGEPKVYNDNVVEMVANDDDSLVRYYVDTRTGVMYMAYRRSEGAGLTVMLNADGTPLLYSEWVKMAPQYGEILEVNEEK